MARPRTRRSRALRRAAVLLLCLAFLAWGYANATRPPLVRSASVKLPDFPTGAPPLRLVLLADTHIQSPDTPPSRVERIVADVNRLHPDVVVLAGDYEGDSWTSTARYSAREVIAPLAALRARLGVYAVLGNHDHWGNRAPGLREALRAAGIRELRNEAAEVGPIALGGVDDFYSGQEAVGPTVARMRALSGAKVLLAHSPRGFLEIPPDIHLLLAGHIHCGQVALPWLGAIFTGKTPRHLGCGLTARQNSIWVVTGGIGTSHLPLRYFAPPDLWLLTVHG